jgi:hypothetical protein
MHNLGMSLPKIEPPDAAPAIETMAPSLPDTSIVVFDPSIEAPSYIHRAPETANWQAESRSGFVAQPATCVACGDNFPFAETVTLSCAPEHHTYCRECVEKVFQTSLTGLTLFPPKCCGTPIPLNACRSFLLNGTVRNIERKMEELGTENATHCCGCGEFIRSRHVKGKKGICVDCRATTCMQCKKEGHDGACPEEEEDPEVKLLMEEVERNKWKQCARCKNPVEKSGGCHHMI